MEKKIRHRYQQINELNNRQTQQIKKNTVKLFPLLTLPNNNNNNNNK